MTETDQVIPQRQAPDQVPVSLANILVATDFSKASDQALHHAAVLAQRFRARIVLLHVLTDVDDLGRPEYGSSAYQTQRRAAEASIEKLLGSQDLQGVPHDVLLKEGYLWDTVEAFVHSHDVDLVAVGTRGAPSLGDQTPGSSAEIVFRQVDCPVLTAGPHCQKNAAQDGPQQPHDAPYGRILFATDFGRAADHATRYVLALAQAFQSKLTLLHVVGAKPNSGAESAILQETARIRLIQSVPEEIAPQLHLEMQVEFGDAPDQILRVARAKQSQLIVMGARAGLRLAMHHLPESSVYTVASSATCPLITVRR